MKYALIVAFFAVLAFSSAFPTQEAEKTEVSDAKGGDHASEPTVKAEEKHEEGVSKPAEKHQDHDHGHEASSTTEEGKTDAATAKSDAADKDGDKCVPGTTFERSCNTCTCTETGSKALSACTLKLCLPEESEKKDATKTE